jgi:hypothetical protein
VNTESEDHAADEWRYACMSRPWIKAKPVEEKRKKISGYSDAIGDCGDRDYWKTI